MRVILLQDIYKHGVAGEVVEVADGFARNYLIPRGMAKKADKGNLKAHRKLMELVEVRRAQYENMLNDVARQIHGVELFFERRAAQTGKLFGSVTSQEITEALDEKTGIDINRRRISQQGLRELGVHEVSVRLGSEISPTLTIHIVREGELNQYLAKLEEGKSAEEAMEEMGIGEDVEAVVEETVEAVLDGIEEGAENVAEALIETAETVTEAVVDAIDELTGDAEDDD